MDHTGKELDIRLQSHDQGLSKSRMLGATDFANNESTVVSPTDSNPTSSPAIDGMAYTLNNCQITEMSKVLKDLDQPGVSYICENKFRGYMAKQGYKFSDDIWRNLVVCIGGDGNGKIDCEKATTSILCSNTNDVQFTISIECGENHEGVMTVA
jgi:hypothetical protein